MSDRFCRQSRGWSEFLLYFNFLIGFNNVAFFDVIAIGQGNTALKVGGDFFHIVLEAFESIDLAGEYDNAVADEAGFVAALHFSVYDIRWLLSFLLS